MSSGFAPSRALFAAAVCANVVGVVQQVVEVPRAVAQRAVEELLARGHPTQGQGRARGQAPVRAPQLLLPVATTATTTAATAQEPRRGS